jgi:hypothetical protein
MSAGSFLQVRFKSVARSFESSAASIHSRKLFRGYIIRYRFTRDNGLDILDENRANSDQSDSSTNSNNNNLTDCKIYYRSVNKRSGYFASPNYPGLYPRDSECHYYFIGQKNEKIQITFHTFDVEGIDQCTSETKSDYVELSNFQNRDRFYSRYCGVNKPGSILSDAPFFHVTFYSNNVFDAKGFQASYYFVNTDIKKSSNSNSNSKSAAAAVSVVSSESTSILRNYSSFLKLNHLILINFIIFVLLHNSA